MTHVYLLARTVLLASLFLLPLAAQEPVSGKPDATMPKASQRVIPETAPDLQLLALEFLDYANVKSGSEQDCKIVVTNFALPDGYTSHYGMQLADKLSTEMASQQPNCEVVERRLLQDLLRKDRIPAKSIDAAVARSIASALKARFVVLGTTTKTDGDLIQLSADLVDLADKDWNGYSVAVDLSAPKASDAMLPSEPFGPLEPITSAGNGDNVFRAGVDGVSIPRCTYMPNPDYSEEARKLRVNGAITAEAVVTAEGRVENVRIVRGLPGGLNENAVAAIQTWLCEPAMRDDNAVASLLQMEVTFHVN